jgi:hypothetical protein
MPERRSSVSRCGSRYRSKNIGTWVRAICSEENKIPFVPYGKKTKNNSRITPLNKASRKRAGLKYRRFFTSNSSLSSLRMTNASFRPVNIPCLTSKTSSTVGIPSSLIRRSEFTVAAGKIRQRSCFERSRRSIGVIRQPFPLASDMTGPASRLNVRSASPVAAGSLPERSAMPACWSSPTARTIAATWTRA